MPSYYNAFDKIMVSNEYLDYLKEIKFYRTEFKN